MLRPQYSRIADDDDAGTVGDCYRACIASLLDLPTQRVPHFMAMPLDEVWAAVDAWLAADRAYQMLAHRVLIWRQ